MKVVGLGTQDSLPEAKEFQEEFNISSTELLWEDGFDSWQALGISAQPAGILLDADGEVVLHRAAAPQRARTPRKDRFDAVRGRADVPWRTDDLMKLLRSDD